MAQVDGGGAAALGVVGGGVLRPWARWRWPESAVRARLARVLGWEASSRRGDLVGGACAGRRGDGGLVRRRRDEAKLQ